MGLFRLRTKRKMPFNRFVEIGRVVVINDGPNKGKIASVVDVLDQNRVLLDGPCTGVNRGEYRIKNLHLTDIVSKFPFSARTKVVKQAWSKDNVLDQWKKTSWAKRMEMKERRAKLNDFDRFKLMKAKSARNKILTKAVSIKKNKLSKKKLNRLRQEPNCISLSLKIHLKSE